LAIKQEVLSRGSTIAERSVDLSAATAPPKASAAPVAGSQDIFAGLCQSLNQHQQEVVKTKTFNSIQEMKVLDEVVYNYNHKKNNKTFKQHKSTTASIKTRSTNMKQEKEKTLNIFN
jgi:hypothetical protein